MLFEHRPTLYVLDPPNYSMREMVLARLPGPLRKRYLAEISTLPKKTEGPWTATPPAIPISEEGFVARTIYSVVQRKMHFIGALKARIHGIRHHNWATQICATNPAPTSSVKHTSLEPCALCSSHDLSVCGRPICMGSKPTTPTSV